MLSLPQELVDSIVDAVPEEELDTLRACSLTHRRLLHPAQRRILSTIRLIVPSHDRDGHPHFFLKLLDESPHLEAYPTALSLRVGEMNAIVPQFDSPELVAATIARRLSNLREVRLVSNRYNSIEVWWDETAPEVPIIFSFLRHAPRLTTLAMHSICLTPCELKYALACIPALERLVLSQVRIIGPVEPPRPPIRRLKSLAVRCTQFPPRRSTDRLLEIIDVSALETLVVEYMMAAPNSIAWELATQLIRAAAPSVRELNIVIPYAMFYEDTSDNIGAVFREHALPELRVLRLVQHPGRGEKAESAPPAFPVGALCRLFAQRQCDALEKIRVEVGAVVETDTPCDHWKELRDTVLGMDPTLVPALELVLYGATANEVRKATGCMHRIFGGMKDRRGGSLVTVTQAAGLTVFT
ncbi:hypothetical protein BD626DRAFT_482071 [Schizophyllum amplum]|uniref:F-box domain-containing protein n=1 Tax=Schizophyllum amplum TaxID=97359 RepID=A0A550CUT7_9AGAR|nr:hypothetical protein BD626DRAFT_482071 [Auriculariopsis ampla]